MKLAPHLLKNWRPEVSVPITGGVHGLNPKPQVLQLWIHSHCREKSGSTKKRQAGDDKYGVGPNSCRFITLPCWLVFQTQLPIYNHNRCSSSRYQKLPQNVGWSRCVFVATSCWCQTCRSQRSRLANIGSRAVLRSLIINCLHGICNW